MNAKEAATKIWNVYAKQCAAEWPAEQAQFERTMESLEKVWIEAALILLSPAEGRAPGFPDSGPVVPPAGGEEGADADEETRG